MSKWEALAKEVEQAGKNEETSKLKDLIPKLDHNFELLKSAMQAFLKYTFVASVT